MLCEDTDCFK